MNSADQFCKDFFKSYVWNELKWLGVPILKNPCDLFIYQEIIYETRPDLIIETGTAFGGSALYLASLCNMMNHGKVVTIDINNFENIPTHPRISYLRGSSTSLEVINQVKEMAKGKSVMVILDSDHEKDHVLSEMETYGELVTIGNYLIVEDTCVNGNPVSDVFGDGPMEAVLEFTSKNKSFVSDAKREKLMFTFNPKGFLRRVS